LTSACRVFAYGSNLAVARIEERVGPVVVVASGRLDGHALRFHKAGRDGSGKADAFATGNPEDLVCGVVYEMDVEAKRKLDRFERLGIDYLEKDVTIATAAGDVAATLYHAHPSRIDPSASPFDWYLALLLDGARRHGLPVTYIERIAAHPARVDTDRVRAEHARRLLAIG
jgi:hypothetical protein